MSRIVPEEAVRILTKNVSTVGTCFVDTRKLCGRILAEDIHARISAPCFARSPYDGYAFLSSDTARIGEDAESVELLVTENIRAGQVPKSVVTSGTAVRLMTGSPIPEGADCVCKYEDTDHSQNKVRIRSRYESGENIVAAGEDILKGSLIAKAGTPVDPGITGMIASSGIPGVKAYKRIKAGVITTGDEVSEIGLDLGPGMIYDSNRYMIGAALASYNAKVRFIGHAGDDRKSIRKLMKKGLSECDLIVSCGGVSVGDYDLVPSVMEDLGFTILAGSVAVKPGMACVYGVKDGTVCLALSGNPASALTNLQCICAPAIRKMAGYAAYDHEYIEMKMTAPFDNKSGMTRFIRGHVGYSGGQVTFGFTPAQGNAVISSAAGTTAYAIVPPYQSIPEGGMTKGFLI